MGIREIFKGEKGSIIKSIINKMIIVSYKYPEIFSDVLRLLEEKIRDRETVLTNSELFLKGQYVVLVGSNGLSKDYIYQIAKNNDILERYLKIFSEFDEVKNSNVDTILKSPNCRAIIFGPTPHSFNAVSRILSQDKIFIEAKNLSGKRKITKHSLELAFKELRIKLLEKT